MPQSAPHLPVIHLELHTGDLARAASFYTQLCGWPREEVRTRFGSYQALGLGRGLGGGIVECGTPRPVWLPYVEVDCVREVTDRGRELGARVVLEPREGPSGWRSVLAGAATGEIALWQPKR